MLSGQKATARFSLLLLEEGEDYVGNWVATSQWPSTATSLYQPGARISGTLRLCTKSLFFDPEDVRLPIIRLPFAHAQQLEAESSSAFNFVSALFVKMKANMADAPYTFEKAAPSTWQFSLSYASLDTFLPQAHQCLAASRLPYGERDLALRALSQDRVSRAPFDASRLVDFSEARQANLPAFLLTPLVREPGRLVVSDRHLYFQPLNDIVGNTPVKVHALAGIAAVARRRSSLQHNALEIFFLDREGGPSWGTASAFIALSSTADRDEIVATIQKQAAFGADVPGGAPAACANSAILEGRPEWLSKVTAAWQAGRITNFGYILFCNLAAGRSFNDLTQYPVFPWVLREYQAGQLDLGDPAAFRDLSKPVGALDAQRLERLRQRFADMRADPEHPPFLYGTHYSCPGYVMYWLVRAAPAHLLRLQNGRFDAPDRMFCSIPDSWDSVMSNPADVKELIPEFFLPHPSFLMNNERLALGQRQSGQVIGDVEVPAWAASAREFLLQHRAALESPSVSANLHHWLDLIFGHKQRGEAAVQADNVFHPLCYEGAADVAAISDYRERLAVEAQINEFGQCPCQLFSEPHPRRLTCPSPDQALQSASDAMEEGHRQGTAAKDVSSLGLSLTLLSSITADTKPQPQPAHQDQQEVELLEKLDVLAQQELPQQGSQAAPDSQGAGPHPPTPRHPRPWAQRLGGLSANITTLVDTVTRPQQPQPGPGKPEGVQAALRGLFQRQPLGGLGGSRGAAAAATPGPGVAAQVSKPQAAREAGQEPAGPQCEAPSGQSMSAARLKAPAQQQAGGSGAGDGPAAEPAHPAAGSAQAAAPGSRPESTASASSPAPPAADSEASSAPCQPSHAGPQTGPQPDLQQQHTRLPPGTLQRLAETGNQWRRQMVINSEGGICALTLCALGDDPLAVCVGHGGAVRSISLVTGAQARSGRLGQLPLTSVVAVPTYGSTQCTVLAGSYDNQVYAFALGPGRDLGSFEAHDDAVTCLVRPDSCPDTLLTGSWDSTVRSWRMAEGRQPWGPEQLAQPQAELADHESGISALDASPQGDAAVVGTEQGTVALWDLRSSALTSQVSLASAPIRALQLLPDTPQLLAISGQDAALLDIRRGLAKVAEAHAELPLTCCQADGPSAVLGTDSGQVLVWNLQSGALQSSGIQAGGSPVAALQTMQYSEQYWAVMGLSTGELSWCRFAERTGA